MLDVMLERVSVVAMLRSMSECAVLVPCQHLQRHAPACTRVCDCRAGTSRHVVSVEALGNHAPRKLCCSQLDIGVLLMGECALSSACCSAGSACCMLPCCAPVMGLHCFFCPVSAQSACLSSHIVVHEHCHLARIHDASTRYALEVAFPSHNPGP